jgi:hypothetical protein
VIEENCSLEVFFWAIGDLGREVSVLFVFKEPIFILTFFGKFFDKYESHNRIKYDFFIKSLLGRVEKFLEKNFSFILKFKGISELNSNV